MTNSEEMNSSESVVERGSVQSERQMREIREELRYSLGSESNCVTDVLPVRCFWNLAFFCRFD